MNRFDQWGGGGFAPEANGADSDADDRPRSLVARDLNVFWHPCSQMRDYQDFPPLEVVEAHGAHLVLADGRHILDAISSWWCKSLGHGHPGVRARIERQLACFEHVITANTTNAALVELCERLLAIANAPSRAGPFGKVFLADNGSTAVEIAMKMALQAQHQRGQRARTEFASLAGGYHGETIATLSVGDLGLYSDPYGALMFPVTKLAPIPYRSGIGDPLWQDASAEWPAIERQLSSLADRLAAIVYEPVLQAAGGMRIYSPDLLRRLRRFADAHGIYLIADEIAAGMGRLGTMLAGELATIRSGHTDGRARTSDDVPVAAVWPDFVVLSKGLTAGFLPLSAVLTTNEIFAHFDGDWASGRAFLHSNTHTGNALAVAAALGALDAYANEGVLPHVAIEGPRLRASLADVARRSGSLNNVRGLGMFAAADLCAPNGGPLDPRVRTGRRVFQEAVKRGALLRPLGDTLYLFPPLNCPRDDIDSMVEILAASVDTVMGTI